MSKFAHFLNDAGHCNRAGAIRFSGEFTIDGTVNAEVISTDCPFLKVTRVAGEDGRYRVQAINSDGTDAKGFTRLEDFSVAVISPSADTVYPAGFALAYFIRNRDAANGRFEIQFARINGTTDNLDTRPQTSCSVSFGFTAKLTTARP